MSNRTAADAHSPYFNLKSGIAPSWHPLGSIAANITIITDSIMGAAAITTTNDDGTSVVTAVPDRASDERSTKERKA